jgi:hypothetical protein
MPSGLRLLCTQRNAAVQSLRPAGYGQGPSAPPPFRNSTPIIATQVWAIVSRNLKNTGLVAERDTVAPPWMCSTPGNAPVLSSHPPG